MKSGKEKRIHERIPFPDVKGSVEISEDMKSITLINACAEGVCISGATIPVGSVVKLAIEDHYGLGDISLYCKVAWTSEKKKKEKMAGLSLLNTNKVLFKKDLLSFNRLIETVQAQARA